jgi:hypothetical protein
MMELTDDDIVAGLNPSLAPGGQEEPLDWQQDHWLSFPYGSDQYAAEVIERYARHLELWGGSRTNVSDAAWAAYRAYHGLEGVNYRGALDPIVSITEAGENGEFLSMRMNQFRGLVKHQIAMVTANRPSWDVLARTTDSKSSSQKMLTQHLLDYEMDGKGKGLAIKTQYEIAKVCAAGFLALGWNENFGRNNQGEVWALPLTPWEVAHEKVRVYTDCNWWIFRNYESRWDWVAKFAKSNPEKARRIKAIQNSHTIGNSFLFEDAATNGYDNDRIEVLYVYARPTRSCPQGRLSIIADANLSLLDGPNPYGDEAPITRICPAEFVGTSIPYGDSWVLLAPDEAFNAVLSMILTRVDTFGVPPIAVPMGSDYKMGDFSGNNLLEIPPGTQDPKVLDMLQIPPELPATMDRLKSGMEDLSGINSVTRGNPNENITSGSMAALVQSMAVQFNSSDEAAWVHNMERVGTMILRIYQRLCTEKQLINICGMDQSWTAREFSGEDLDQIDRVAIKMGNAFQKTLAGKEMIADKLLQAQVIQSPQEYVEALGTGNVTPLFKGPVDLLAIIKAENEKILHNAPVKVLPTDNDQLHIREHVCMLDSAARYDPALAGRITAHLGEHINSWTEKTLDHPDMLEAIGQPPLSAAQQMRAQKEAAAQGLPPPQQGAPQPGPRGVPQPNTEAPPKGTPGPKGQQGAQGTPKLPEPSKTPSGQPVV